ncbi:hypothetical protein FHW36_104460 [Chitinophaga polysaccharea]|uniref:Uncharacterized protein n=1 Tax=Chitinophaga polysaccharea TaxID=1293035 RepID=A0A561PRM2_9BACT|nr:hypothetical protein [Chitinophaga polysaccharea]TWF40775.1 hypothetical protein FHW36_104460 [Chitinophaga polysaccharea]
MIKEHSLIASVALFGELYNNNKYKSVSDIIAEFIKGAILEEQKWSVNSTELRNSLINIFEFTIPEAVLKNTLKTKLKKYCIYKDGVYNFDSAFLKKNFSHFDDEYNKINAFQSKILDGLYNYIETDAGVLLDEEVKATIFDDFVKYLLDNGYSETYTEQISTYIVKNQLNDDFVKSLNTIREGLILYQGIRYTSDVNDLGNWNSELTIFLNTEHLFNAVGFNGEVYRQIFNDFYDLVTKINQKSRNKNNKRLIELAYLPETNNEINEYFEKAEQIKRGERKLDPSRPAMRAIIKDCRTPFDIRQKYKNFITEINSKGIFFRETDSSVYNFHQYVVEGKKDIDTFKRESKERGKLFSEGDFERFGKIFSQINYFRKGRNDTTFEKVGFIFLTANSFALWLSSHPKIKFHENDLPFAVSIESITCRFWFKLCKGFGEFVSLPKSLGIVTKAQIILASQVNSSVSKRYDQLKQELYEGKHNAHDFQLLVYDLREHSKLPEEIDESTVDDSIDFILNEEYIETFYKNQELLAKENSDLKNQVKEYEQEKRRRDEIALEQEQHKKLEQFISSKTTDYQKDRKSDIFYYLKAACLLFAAALPIGLIKVKPFSEKLDQLGGWGVIIIIFLVWLGLIEGFRRSYIHDKEKIKRGRAALFLWFKFQAEKELFLAQEKWRLEFRQQDNDLPPINRAIEK